MGFQIGDNTTTAIKPLLDRHTVYYGIELDNDNIKPPYENGGWDELLGETLVEFVQRHPKSKAFTVWTGSIPSVSFHHQSYSCVIVFGGIGVTKVKDAVYAMLQLKVGATLIRYSDGIHGSEVKNWRDAFHAESGVVWTPVDTGVWGNCTLAVSEATSSTVESNAIDDILDDEDGDLDTLLAEVLDDKPGIVRRIDRKRRVRSDAGVGKVLARLENELGIPVGALAVLQPDKKSRYKSNTSMARVRRDWGLDQRGLEL